MTGAVRVEITQTLRESLERQNIDSGVLVSDFRDWKTDWPREEYESSLFGKDSSYARPRVDGRAYELRHVHLVPLKDAEALRKWERALDWRRRKTSDRVLVYAGKDGGPYLLIFILDEPDAHTIAEMHTREDRETMEGFAEVAAAFLDDGDIIC
jgi:mRNA interferase YafO